MGLGAITPFLPELENKRRRQAMLTLLTQTSAFLVSGNLHWTLKSIIVRGHNLKIAAGVQMTVLFTGGAGYIGSHMVHALLDAGERVVVLDNLATGFDWAVAQGALLVIGDAGNP